MVHISKEVNSDITGFSASPTAPGWSTLTPPSARDRLAASHTATPGTETVSKKIWKKARPLEECIFERHGEIRKRLEEAF